MVVPVIRATSSCYTAKIAGTEKGVTEPQATFSPCFGAPFMALSPAVYARLLQDKIAHHRVNVWLINTGWSGGPYSVGQRVKIAHTRAMVHAVLDGSLAKAPMRPDPNFAIAVPTACPGVPSELLNPRHSWADKAAYDVQARKLAAMFEQNFKTFAKDVVQEASRSTKAG
jgi:phosphoenolpyruvate carboxykinase (ATP)